MPIKGQRMPPEQRQKIAEAHAHREAPTSKHCPCCQEIKPASAFRPRKPGGFVLVSYCRPCEQQKSKADWQAQRAAKGPRPTSMQRFMEKVVKDPSGCWLFTGARKPNGYGNFKPAGRPLALAHRWSYEQHKGPIPEGLQLDHLCRTRHCVNPDHLEPVTGSTNIRRSSRWPGMQERETQLLEWLAEHPGSSGSQVGQAVGISSRTAYGVLARLEREGRVTSVYVSSRRRLFSLAETEPT